MSNSGSKKRIRWSLIEKFWPDGQPFAKSVRAVKKGSCNACGMCCALVRIGVDHEYMREQIHAMRVWAPSHGKVLTPDEKRCLRDYTFMLKHWVRVPRTRAAERGFLESVDSSAFVYHCLLLTKDGKCAAHDRERPKVCEDFPFYEGYKWPKGSGKFKPNVRVGCGFATRRSR